MLCILYSQFHDFLSGNFTHREGRFEQVAKKIDEIIDSHYFRKAEAILWNN